MCSHSKGKFQGKSPIGVCTGRCTSFYLPLTDAAFFPHKAKARSSTIKKIMIRFIVVVGNQACNISEVCLYSVSLGPTWFARFKDYKMTRSFQKPGFHWPFKFLNCPFSHIIQTFRSWQPNPKTHSFLSGCLHLLWRSFYLTFFLTHPTISSGLLFDRLSKYFT